MNNYLLSKKAKLDVVFWKIRKEGLKKCIAKKFDEYVKDENGAGVIELVLILVVLIGFVVIFKDRIKELLDNVYNKINIQANSLYDVAD